MLKAIIFDMDGVIIDSEPMHAKAAYLALGKYCDITMDYIKTFIGSTTYIMCQKTVEDFQLNISPEKLLKENNEMKEYLLKAEGHSIVPNVIDLIKDLHKNGMKLIIASSSSSEEIQEVIKSLDIGKYFVGYVSGVDIKHTKPAPDIFLKAAKYLKVEPEECLVIEDSFHGVCAANSAGITCVGYVNPNSGNQDLSKADILVEGFEEVDYAFLKQFYDYLNNPKIIVTSDKFIIRELAVSDIADLYSIYQQPGIKEYIDDFTDNLALEQEKHKAYIKNIYHLYGYGLWGIFLKESGKLIGRCGIELKMLDNEEIYELGYLLSNEYQGMGYAREFVSEVIQFCFEDMDIPRIVAVIDQSNLRSLHLAQQLGMTKYSESIRSHHHCFKYEITPIGYNYP